MRIGQQKQLLVDNEMLADWWKLRRVQSQVKKHPQNPVLEADQLWEESARRSWGILPTAVLHDAEEGRLKLWYKIYQKDNGAVVAYATSSNGVHWTKPYLGAGGVCWDQPEQPVPHRALGASDDGQLAPGTGAPREFFKIKVTEPSASPRSMRMALPTEAGWVSP